MGKKISVISPGTLEVPGHVMTFPFTWLCVCMCVLSCVWLFAIPWTIVHQIPLPWDSPGKDTRVGCISCSRESSWPRDWTRISCVSCIDGQVPYIVPLGKPSPSYLSSNTQSLFYRVINLLSLISMIRGNMCIETLKSCFISLLYNLPVSFKKGNSVSNVIYLHHTHTHTHTHTEPSSLNNLAASLKNIIRES